MSLHRQLGERARTVTREKNYHQGGAEECRQTFKNIAPEEATQFDNEWVTTAEQHFTPNASRVSHSSGSQYLFFIIPLQHYFMIIISHSRPMISATPYDRPHESRAAPEQTDSRTHPCIFTRSRLERLIFIVMIFTLTPHRFFLSSTEGTQSGVHGQPLE